MVDVEQSRRDGLCFESSRGVVFVEDGVGVGAIYADLGVVWDVCLFFEVVGHEDESFGDVERGAAGFDARDVGCELGVASEFEEAFGGDGFDAREAGVDDGCVEDSFDECEDEPIEGARERRGEGFEDGFAFDEGVFVFDDAARGVW